MLAVLSNAARLCRQHGASEEEVAEAVDWGYRTPEPVPPRLYPDAPTEAWADDPNSPFGF